jgi:Mrp family chromosome partitioning ATPase/capsular polysaccharide biosynthesis protein
MLDAPVASPETVWSTPADTGPTVTIADVVVFLRQQFWHIAGAVVLAVALAVLYVALTPAQYVGRADLLIEPSKQHALWQGSGVVDLTIDNAEVESQVEVLQSERIANDVIAKLGLVNDPEFRKTGTDYERQRATLAQFESALSARRIGQSYVIEVSFRSLDPGKAAQITNAITDAYLRDQQQAKRDVADQASQWMEDQVTALGVQLNTAAGAVQQFRVSHGLPAIGGTNDQPQLIDKLTELEARAQAYRKVYEALLERFTQNQEQASYPVSNARVITSASRPLAKSYPKTKLVLLLSILVGLVAGIANAAARSMLDGSVRSANQLRRALGLPVLGTLPIRRVERGQPDTGIVDVVDAPLSPFSEAMRHVKFSVQRATGSRSGRCIGLISLLPGQEMSVVAFNLAALFRTAGSKTLLVDADLRDRRLTERLAPAARIGLAEALLDGSTDKLLYERKIKGYLLPVGNKAPVTNSADLLDSPALPSLLSSFKEQFSTIVVGLPALQRVGDARAVAPLLDGCILVALHGRTPVRALQEAADLLRADEVNLLGVVITGVSENIPPLFGMHLDPLREFDYVGFAQQLARSMRQRWARVGSR